MSLYLKFAEQLQYVSPSFYKKRFFKKLINLDRGNILQRNVEPELIWLKNFIDKDAVFIDIGANVGAYLFLLEQKLTPQNIFAFEPNKKLFTRLKRLFPSVNVFPYALSNENKIAEFKIPVIKGKLVASRGTLQTDFREEEEEETITQKVEVMTMDSWISTQKINKVDFIKIDVEGNERETLSGAKALIQKFKPVLMVEMEQRHHQEPIKKIISEIEDWGFSAHFLDRKDFNLKPVSDDILDAQNSDEVKVKKSYINNIIFLPTA